MIPSDFFALLIERAVSLSGVRADDSASSPTPDRVVVAERLTEPSDGLDDERGEARTEPVGDSDGFGFCRKRRSDRGGRFGRGDPHLSALVLTV